MELWKQAGFPHKGWKAETVIDLREDEERDFDGYESCQACGRERIRFVHVLAHAEYQDRIRVGCICAEKLTDDYIGPRGRESDLRNLANRRAKFVNEGWRRVDDGRIYRKMRGYNLGMTPQPDGTFKIWIGREQGKFTYRTEMEAKLKMFAVIERRREKGNEFAMARGSSVSV